MNDDKNIPNPELNPEILEPATDESATLDSDRVDAEAPATASTEKEPWQPSWRTWVAVAASAAVIGVAAVFGISAATSSNSSGAAASSQAAASNQTGGGGTAPAQGARPGFGGGGFGTIASIDGSNLTIQDRSGTTTKVVTSSSTSVTKSASGTAGDIKVGDTVMVVGTGSSSTIAATRVTDDGKVSAAAGGQGAPGGGRPGNGGPPAGGAGAFNGRQAPGGAGAGAAGQAVTRGVVASVGNGTFTVTGIDGTAVTVTTSSSTAVSIAKTATLADLQVGDTVMVRGAAANGTITATSIRDGVLGGGPPGANPRAAPSTGSQQ